MAFLKVVIYKIHTKKLGIKAVLGDVFCKSLQARYFLTDSDQCIEVIYNKVNRSKLNTTIDEPNWS